MTNKFGIMQGRLLPKLNSRYQAHPIGYWQDEFLIAKKLKLDLIEFIFDFNDYLSNPLMSIDGKEIDKIICQTGVEVKTICADYFMEAPIHSQNDYVSKKVFRFKQLIKYASHLSITDIVCHV